MSGEGIPVKSEVPPPPEKLQRTSKAPTQLYSPLPPDFRHLIRRLSNQYCPKAYSTAVSHPMSTSRLWIVRISSVGTESVGIVWCTHVTLPAAYTDAVTVADTATNSLKRY